MRRGWVVLFALAQVVWSVAMRKHMSQKVDAEANSEMDKANWDDILKDAEADTIIDPVKRKPHSKESMLQGAIAAKAEKAKAAEMEKAKAELKEKAKKWEEGGLPMAKDPASEVDADQELDVMYASLVASKTEPVKVETRLIQQRKIDAIYTAMSFFAVGLVAFAWMYLRYAICVDPDDPKAQLRAQAQAQAAEFFAQKASSVSAESVTTESTDDDLFSEDESEATPFSPGLVKEKKTFFEQIQPAGFERPNRSVRTTAGSVKARASMIEEKVKQVAEQQE